MSVEPPGAPQEASGVSEECKLFVGGISWHMSGSELEEKFSPYGRCEATIMLDRHTGRSRGFGFVIFHKIADAEEAIKALHETDVDGRKVSVTKAIPQSQTAPGTPAAALLGHRRGDRYGDRRDRPYDRDDRYGSRSSAQERRPGYDRGYGRPPDRGYDRPGYPDYSAYDRGYAEYGRDRYVPPPYGYDGREGYGYEARDPYARYERDGYSEQRGGYYGYERDPAYAYDRGSYPSYPDSRGYSDRPYMDRQEGARSRAPGGDGAYDSRGAGSYPPGYSSRASTGPDRSRYGGARPTPYERGPGMRSSERGPAP